MKLLLNHNYGNIENEINEQREREMSLEAGEVLGFEFYNGSEHTTETIIIEVAIEKM